MGEEKKDDEPVTVPVPSSPEAKKEDEKKDDSKKEEEKKKEGEEEAEPEPPQEIVLKVDMHCEACARKVARSLKGFQGVEDVMADCKASKVVVKGKTADPIKVCERVQKKSRKKVELISPLPKPPSPPVPPPPSEEDPKQDDKNQQDQKKEEPPAVITVVLNVRMHCEACAQVLQKRIRKIKGVESVIPDIANDQVIVKGVVDPDKLVKDVYKRTGKQASVVKEEEKKEDKKDEEKEEKKEEKVEEKKQEEGNKEEDDTKTEIKKSEYWPPPRYYMEYSYPPQMFSDENPNACSVM